MLTFLFENVKMAIMDITPVDFETKSDQIIPKDVAVKRWLEVKRVELGERSRWGADRKTGEIIQEMEKANSPIEDLTAIEPPEWNPIPILDTEEDREMIVFCPDAEYSPVFGKEALIAGLEFAVKDESGIWLPYARFKETGEWSPENSVRLKFNSEQYKQIESLKKS